MEVEKERNRKGRKSNILHCYFSFFSLFFYREMEKLEKTDMRKEKEMEVENRKGSKK